MLKVRGITAGYGSGTVLRAVDLEVRAGEVVALLGRNGMGRTTLIRCLTGQLPVRAGEIRFGGRAIQNLPSHKIARLGMALAPEGRQVFPNLTVLEHLQAFGRRNRKIFDDEAIFALFPRLAERRFNLARNLSGGEQQMLAIARALCLGPVMLLLDEASEGLAPLLRREIWRCLAELKAQSLTILVVDRLSGGLTAVADRCLVMARGEIVWGGLPGDLARDPELHARLGV